MGASLVGSPDTYIHTVHTNIPSGVGEGSVTFLSFFFARRSLFFVPTHGRDVCFTCRMFARGLRPLLLGRFVLDSCCRYPRSCGGSAACSPALLRGRGLAPTGRGGVGGVMEGYVRVSGSAVASLETITWLFRGKK